METKDKFLNNLSEKVKTGDIIVLGISGGIDSVVMLDLFVKHTNAKLAVAHLNHGTRKESSDDEKFVENLAKKHKLEFFSKKITPPDFGNLEEELRLERHRFLEEVREKTKARSIALAHNANDQAETFFLNAIRGSGPAGLAAIKETDKIIRPLLYVSRKEIAEYAKENFLHWHEDVTNVDISYARNYLRREVLPLLSKINPEWLVNINRTSSLQKNIDEYLKKEASKYLKAKVDLLKKLDKPILYEVFGLLYEKARGDRIDLTLTHLVSIDDMISTTAGTKQVKLPHDIIAIRTYENLDFKYKNEYNLKSQPEEIELQFGDNTFGEWVLTVTKTKKAKTGKDNISVSSDFLSSLKVRNRQPGDKIKTFGGEKKLQDLFVNAKIRREERELWPVITVRNKVIWVPGLAVDRDLPKENLTINIRARNLNGK